VGEGEGEEEEEEEEGGFNLPQIRMIIYITTA
jgi:hypothetical protein